MVRRWSLVTGVLLVLLALASGAQRQQPAMRTYQTRYYVIHTDLEPDQAKEAAIRMTRMAEEYARRTRDFGGTVRHKLPFYLYKDREDYYATGSPRQSAGRFDGRSLLAVAEDFGPKTWHIVQHEGFHQFSNAVISANLPPWVDEGMAEYFGESVFTGDGYVTGVIPQWRLERIRKRFADDQFMSLSDLMALPLSEWNQELSLANYDQAWSIVQFLAHGDEGRYQKALGSFMGQLGRKQSGPVAWQRTFGSTRGLEQRWRAYWTTLPDHPTGDLYAEATVRTLTSFLARATSQQQRFEDMNAFADAAVTRSIKHHREDWLPPRLLQAAIAQAQDLTHSGATFVLEPMGGSKLPQIRCTLSDGTVIVGTFTLIRGRVGTISVQRFTA